MTYNKIFETYNSYLTNRKEIIATFLIDTDSGKYIRDIKKDFKNEDELIKILESSLQLISNTKLSLNSLIIESDECNILFSHQKGKEDYIYVIVSDKKLALGAILSILKKISLGVDE